jgi:hypothetical protein
MLGLRWYLWRFYKVRKETRDGRKEDDLAEVCSSCLYILDNTENLHDATNDGNRRQILQAGERSERILYNLHSSESDYD